MNKTNGLRDQAGASTSLYTKEHQKSTNQRSSTSGLSFLKWFKKNEKSIDSRSSTNSVSHKSRNYNSHETLSPASSPNLGYLSPSSSCDSVVSTSTTGFAFIQPNNYRPDFSDFTQKNLYTQEAGNTSSYRRANGIKPELTLRRKYCLYDADTLTSTEGEYDNVRYADRSLPHLRKKSRDEHRTFRARRKTRRTVSDSFKDKKAGAYVHVKGKRKAPPPPPPVLTNGNASRETLTKSATTLNRKKRKAPPPPTSPIESVLSGGLLDDTEIKAFIGTSSTNRKRGVDENNAMRSSAEFMTRETEEFNAARRLTEEQKQIVIDNIVKVNQSLEPSEEEVQAAPPVSPISPRPWYKRPISTNRESTIPFKREIILKTMEKRKSKQKDKDPKAGNTPEVTHSRSSLFDSTSKFGFFLRNKDHSDRDKEKRRSGIGIPNISELDREAAEIVNREYATAKASEKSESERFFNTADHIVLQQKMFGSKTNIVNDDDEPEEQPIKSTKDLISKFEATTNSPRITLNTSFIGRKDNFLDSKNMEKEKKIDETGAQFVGIQTNAAVAEDLKPSGQQDKPADNNAITKISWTCPFCTLENPNWRIICEVCERIKPYDKRTSIEVKVQPSSKVEITAVLLKDENLNNNLNSKATKVDQSADWEKKTEKVLKYFMPRSTNNSPLAKSSSETTITKRQAFRKSPSPSRPKLGSPQFNLRNRLSNLNQPDLIKPQGFPSGFDPTNSIPEEKENLSPTGDQKPPLLDSSVIVTTVTPVFYASTTQYKNPDVIAVNESKIEEVDPDVSFPNESKIDLNEVRNARLAKFSATQQPISSEPIPISDHDSLEREKKRLRDMIQAMNAKAFAEKYPVLRKSSSIDETKSSAVAEPKRFSNDQTKLGAIKKVFAKRNSDQPKNSPDREFEKPKKVSTSAQTAGVLKKSLTPEDCDRLGENIYANVPIYENNLYGINDRLTKFSEYENANVQEISDQLKSVQGINDLKATLRNPPKGISATDTIALNKIMRNLETAICEGQDELAAKIAMDLAKMKISLHVTKQTNRPVSKDEVDFEKNIIVDMFVEDKYSHKGPIQMSITPLLTILKLKQKICVDFDIPIGVQRWLVNDKLASDDDKTLLEFGVKDQTATFYLYIIAPDVHFYEVKKTNIQKPLLPKPILKNTRKHKFNETINDLPKPTDIEEQIGAAALPDLTPTPEKPTDWSCPLCTLVNTSDRLACLACSETKPACYQKQYQNLIEGGVQLRPAEKRNDLNKTNPNRKSSDIFNIVDIKIDIKKTVTEQIKQLPNVASPNITKRKYRGVDNFNPNRKDSDQSSTSSGQSEHVPRKTLTATKKNPHYLELLSLDNTDIVPNVEPFECPICFMKFDTAEGAILRDCLHTFCKECLTHTVQYSEDAEIKCPYMDADYSCDSVLQEREVKALVTKDIYELHLVKSMRVAEHQIENAFHCKTPNCRGWCIYEDKVNQFKCPVCRITNCLTCRVIHDGLTCKQFQDRLNSDCDSNIEAKRTKQMLEEMVEKGEAMNCPTCQVVMMKKWGCDWLKCSMCKTEICWVTRGPRWGPGGKGDTSAGCKCGVDSVKCHPKCNYCH